MFSGNTHIIVFSVMVFVIIIFVSSIASILKTLLIFMTIVLLFPVIKKWLIRDRWRKIKVAIYTSITFSIGFLLFALILAFNEDQLHLVSNEFPMLLFVLFYSLVGNILYGVPVSLLADYISNKFPKNRCWISGVTHFGFGFAVYFLLSGLSIPVIICSILFFSLDELTRITHNKGR